MKFVVNKGNAITAAGTYEVTVSLDNRDELVKRSPDVGGCYNITVNPGTLTVTAPQTMPATGGGGTTPTTPAPTTPAPTTPAVTTTPAAAAPAPVVTELPAVLGEVREDALDTLVAENPGVLGMRRDAQETQEVLGARRAQTGDVSMTVNYIIALSALSVTVLLFLGEKKRRANK